MRKKEKVKARQINKINFLLLIKIYYFILNN